MGNGHPHSPHNMPVTSPSASRLALDRSRSNVRPLHNPSKSPNRSIRIFEGSHRLLVTPGAGDHNSSIGSAQLGLGRSFEGSKPNMGHPTMLTLTNSVRKNLNFANSQFIDKPNRRPQQPPLDGFEFTRSHYNPPIPASMAMGPVSITPFNSPNDFQVSQRLDYPPDVLPPRPSQSRPVRNVYEPTPSPHYRASHQQSFQPSQQSQQSYQPSFTLDYRQNGSFQDQSNPPETLQSGLLSRKKIDSALSAMKSKFLEIRTFSCSCDFFRLDIESCVNRVLQYPSPPPQAPGAFQRGPFGLLQQTDVYPRAIYPQRTDN